MRRLHTDFVANLAGIFIYYTFYIEFYRISVSDTANAYVCLNNSTCFHKHYWTDCCNQLSIIRWHWNIFPNFQQTAEKFKAIKMKDSSCRCMLLLEVKSNFEKLRTEDTVNKQQRHQHSNLSDSLRFTQFCFDNNYDYTSIVLCTRCALAGSKTALCWLHRQCFCRQFRHVS